MRIFVDAHVHIHDCFQLGVFFDSAYSNFSLAAAGFTQKEAFVGVLLLAESTGADWFHRLRAQADTQPLDEKLCGENQWFFKPTREKHSVCLLNESGAVLYLIAGRQCVTAEHLEVLALFTEDTFDEGIPIKNLIDEIKFRGALPVVPWGFGKWLGRRGKLLSELLEREKSAEFCLGDNGGRTGFLPFPSQFRLAEKREIPILPGTDPLPFSSEQFRVGSYGFSIRGKLSHEYPGGTIQSLVKNSQVVIIPYGQLTRPLKFLGNQLGMQFIKRRRHRERVSL
jgi:hypothetical protein